MTEGTKLTDAQRETIAKTVAVVAANMDRITPVFYRTMFANNPEVLAFFNQSNQHSGRQPAALARAVVASIGAIDDLSALGNSADVIVHKHCALGILPEHYPTVKNNLLLAVAEVLGEAVTPAVADAYGTAVQIVAEFLIEREEVLYAKTDKQLNPPGVPHWSAREAHDFKVVTADHHSTPKASILTLARVDGAPAPPYVPGQYVCVCNNPNPGAHKLFAPRSYTVARAPDVAPETLRIVVRHLGEMSTYLSTRSVGDVLQLRPPQGNFTPGLIPRAKKVVLITAGIGLTPALALLPKFIKLHGAANVSHVHIAHNAASVPFSSELEAMGHHETRIYTEDVPRASLSLKRVLEGPTSHGIDLLKDKRTMAMFCGPPELMFHLLEDSAKAGITDRVHHEAFGPAALRHAE